MSYYIIIRGPLGSGKTTVARKLAKAFHAEYIAVDRILDEYDLTGDHEDGYISQKSFLKANEIVIPEARRLLSKEKIVIFDGNFYWKSQIEDLIQKLNFSYYIFTLKIPLQVCIECDSGRKNPHGIDAATAVYKKSTSFDFGINIDATKPLDAIIDCIMACCLHY